jgi:hypothetical protein
MATVNKLPADYVDYLCHPGLKTNAGTVALQRYMSVSKGNKETEALFQALINSGIRDTDTMESARDVMPANEWAIMEKGQGYHVYFVRLWNWMWDNQEQMRDGKNKYLRENIYNEYFRDREATGCNPFRLMVRDHYFGMECIGFVSSYLRYAGVWKSYLGVDNHHWKLHFQNGVNTFDDVNRLDLLEWVEVGHIALVDAVHGVTNGKLVLDVSQCSGYQNVSGGLHPGFNGPMKNKGVYLTDSGEAVDGLKVFKLGGDVPVPGKVQVRRMRGLVYAGAR